MVGGPSQPLHRELAERGHPGHPLPVSDRLPGLHLLITGQSALLSSRLETAQHDVVTQMMMHETGGLDGFDVGMTTVKEVELYLLFI